MPGVEFFSCLVWSCLGAWCGVSAGFINKKVDIFVSAPFHWLSCSLVVNTTSYKDKVKTKSKCSRPRPRTPTTRPKPRPRLLGS